MVDSQMYNFTVKSSIKDYDVVFDSIDNIEIREGDLIIIDDNINIHFDNSIRIKSNETVKEYSNIFHIINSIIDKGFKRNNRLIAIGGGVIQDTTGFISSMLFRGVEWVFYPTTLLSQGDSCIGSKTSINVGDTKNLVGNFYPPSKVVIDTNLITTLPHDQIMSGIGEMCHYFLIDGVESSIWFKKNYLQTDKLEELIYKSLMIKKKMIEIDEFDQKERKVFNYGHSFGHAIETMTNYEIPHGIAVAYGMTISNFLSHKLGYISFKEFGEMEMILSKIHSHKDLKEFDLDQYIETLKKDKKNVASNLGIILTRGRGDMFLKQLPVETVSGIIKGIVKSQFHKNDLPHRH